MRSSQQEFAKRHVGENGYFNILGHRIDVLYGDSAAYSPSLFFIPGNHQIFMLYLKPKWHAWAGQI